LEYAAKKKVTIVSPVTMIAVLQTVIQGLKSNQIEKSVHEILKSVDALDRHLRAYDEYMRKLGNNLGTTVNSYNIASKELGKVNKDVYKLTAGASGATAEVLQLDKPKAEDE
jgi:DNA anti-recombination protein RmuC